MASINGESSEIKLDSQPRQRGAVEEIISKRLKTLTKKIVRIKGYKTTTLNADQQAAIASLPPLEAVAKELEELIKPGGPIETTELAQAGQLREVREEMLALQEEEVARRVEEYKREMSGRLSSFLRAHESGEEGARGMYEDLKSGNASLDILRDFEVQEERPRFTAPSEGTSDGASDVSYDDVPPLEHSQEFVTPMANGRINFLQQDEIEFETPKAVDWSDEVEDDTPIFDGDKQHDLIIPQKEDVKEEIPVLEPVVPIQSEQPPAETAPSQPPAETAPSQPSSATPSDKKQKNRRPNKPKSIQSDSPTTSTTPSQRQRTNGSKPKSSTGSGLPPKPVDDGFEQVVRKQASRGRGAFRGGGGAFRGRGRGRGGAAGAAGPGAVLNGEGK